MVDQNLINEIELDESEIESALSEIGDLENLGKGFDQEKDIFKPGSIIKGRIVGRAGDDFVVDVGLKSEGTISKNEWDDPSEVDVGDTVSVWLEAIESDSGQILLSKRKADRALNWQSIIETKSEGDVVTGRVMRKIKGGLLVDIGVPVFLPASQVDIRRPGDIGEFIGQEIEAKILKIDTDRRNIVISRRELIEQARSAAKEKLLAEIKLDEVRTGKVKNIANFGAFVDLGGIDGLLHITDMSWDRVGHPSDLLKIDDVIEVKILNIDHAKEKIALGLKQLTPNPWNDVEQRYPVHSRVQGEVVNITPYGAFVKLEAGVEGLIHISEMSWTRRINHPSELLAVGDKIEAVVLDVNKDKQEISLGLKQIESNPWERVAEKYPPNTRIKGIVRNITNYGVFVEIEQGIDGLLHISDMSWTKKISHPSEMLSKGDEIECVVLKVEQDKQRIALGLRQLHEDPWVHAVPANYIPGQIVEGTVTKITNFGVFIELEPDLEGLLHVSELADHKIEDPHDEVKIGEKLQVKILRVDTVERKIGLSRKRAAWSEQQQAEADEAEGTAKVRRGGLDHGFEALTVAEEPEKPAAEASAPAEAEAEEAKAEPEPEPKAEPDTEAATETAVETETESDGPSSEEAAAPEPTGSDEASEPNEQAQDADA